MDSYSEMNAQEDSFFAEMPFSEVPFEDVPFDEGTSAEETAVSVAVIPMPSAVPSANEPPAAPVKPTYGPDTDFAFGDSGAADNAAAEEEARRKAGHEAAEAQRKADFDARQAEKKKNYQLQLLKMQNMSDDDVMMAAAQRAGQDTEKITRRSMKECVSEHIQTLCFSDPAFARLTMHPRKNMIHCFMYINRKAQEYVQDEIKVSGIQHSPGMQVYSTDIPDDLCYQWAEDYFRDPTVKEDEEQEERFVPRPFQSKSGVKTLPKKPAEKKKTTKKSTEKKEPEPKKLTEDGQMSFGQMAMV
jgi:hypothetical protein